MNKISFTLDVDKEIKAGTLTVGKMDARKCRLKKYSAKEMFEELGYFKHENEEAAILYSTKHFISDTTYIEFYKEDKSFSKYTNSDSPFESSKVEYITFEELKAINKQIEELGWR